MAKKNETALAVADNFKIANRYEGMDPEMMAELQDQMEDLDPESGISCRTIKIPAGGKLAFEVQSSEDDDFDYPKEINGVIIFTHRLNGFWPNAFGTSSNQEDKIPACSSMDGKTGLWLDTGELRTCESCPMNQFGSATDQKGEQAKGKACKNMRRQIKAQYQNMTLTLDDYAPAQEAAFEEAPPQADRGAPLPFYVN